MVLPCSAWWLHKETLVCTFKILPSVHFAVYKLKFNFKVKFKIPIKGINKKPNITDTRSVHPNRDEQLLKC